MSNYVQRKSIENISNYRLQLYNLYKKPFPGEMGMGREELTENKRDL
jgi:hypothetical protein